MDQPAQLQPWKLVVIGLGAGLVGGGLGVGGGIVLVPMLLAVGAQRHRAHATSLAAIVLIAVSGAVSFGVSGELDIVLGITIGVGGVVGSTVGASVMHRASARTLTVVFAVVLLVAGIRLIAGADPVAGTSGLSNAGETAIALGVGVVAGFFAGLAGIGGGVVIVPSAVLLLGLEQHEAQGTSLVAIVLTALAGSYVNFRNQRVRPMDGLMVGVGGVVGALTGARVALGVEARTLSLVFGFLVLFVALRSLYRVYRQPAV
ncbi:MAG: sulfite exporter TauE/SafE family protein [Acidimicrobiia bacterium]